MKLCSVDGCQRPFYAKSYCALHYKRVRKSGDPLSVKQVRHGHSGGLEYKTWQMMRNRCENHKARFFKDYGGRGIRVCERWQDFSAFLSDMGMRPTPGIRSTESTTTAGMRHGTVTGSCARRTTKTGDQLS